MDNAYRKGFSKADDNYANNPPISTADMDKWPTS